MSGQIGLITEQGDLGLGFDPLSQADQAIVEQQDNQKPNENCDNGSVDVQG